MPAESQKPNVKTMASGEIQLISCRLILLYKNDPAICLWSFISQNEVEKNHWKNFYDF